ncbi:hypothetical protein ACWDTP_09585 [Mycobacterium sp. NPDC003449]
MTATLGHADFLRAPVLAAARPEGFKEWHHFVVHADGTRLLVNFSLTDQAGPGGRRRLVPRVIVIVHDGGWSGVVERFDDADVDLSADLAALVIGGNRMVVRPDGYRVSIDLPGPGIRAEIAFTAVSRPFVVNNQPVGAGRMSWLFVPRLRADGWLSVDGRGYDLDAAVAYHDHNWGRFRWGDDFGWTWGAILPGRAGDPWSAVFLAMTDRRRLRCLSQALYVWHHDEPAAIFRHAAVRTRSGGRLGRGPDCTLPPPMGILLDGELPGVPERVEVAATRAGDTVRAEFLASSYARLGLPGDVSPRHVTVLCECAGTARLTGTIGGREIDAVGVGVFEFLHG